MNPKHEEGKIRNSVGNADPSKFSFLDKPVSLKEIDFFDNIESIFEESRFYGFTHADQETGERFIKIMKSPEVQKAISMILKGVVNVSDVISFNGEYYSHVQNFENISFSKEKISEETIADMLILDFIFGDFDHEYYTPSRGMRIAKGIDFPAPKILHKNLIINEQQNKSTFFDFDKGKLIGVSGETNNYNTLSRDYLSSSLKRVEEKIFPENIKSVKNVIRILKNKIKKLIELFPENLFPIFKKIITKSGLKIDEDSILLLFENFKYRLYFIEDFLNTYEV